MKAIDRSHPIENPHRYVVNFLLLFNLFRDLFYAILHNYLFLIKTVQAKVTIIKAYNKNAPPCFSHFYV